MLFSNNLPLLGLVIATVALAIWGMKLLVSRTRLKTELAECRHRQTEDEQTLTAVRTELEQKKRELDLSRSETQARYNDFIRVQSDFNAVQSRLTEVQNEARELKRTQEELLQERTRLLQESAEYKARIEAQDKLMQASVEREALARSELEQRLTALGEKMLQERGEALNKSSQLQLQQTVGPLSAELKSFREAMTLSQKVASEQSGAMKTELQKLQQAQLTLSRQAEDLTRALAAGGKKQGLWGEHQLELCLDAAGLQQGRDYEREVSVKADDHQARPDVVLYLPEHHCLIIDAKCSLTAYSRAFAAATEQERDEALRAHVSSVRTHIDELSKKSYEKLADFNSPSFVFMFVPIDRALSDATRQDPEIYNYAAQKNVYLVSPSTLLPALRVTANLWLLASQNDKVREIALQAQRIYEKLEGVNEAFEAVMKSEGTLQKNLNLLQTRLNSGRGNLTRQLSSFAYKAPHSLQEAGVDMEIEVEDAAEETYQVSRLKRGTGGTVLRGSQGRAPALPVKEAAAK